MADLSIGRALGLLARREPDRPAVVVGDEVVTRRRLDQETNRLARAWTASGVRTDDVVAVDLPTGVDAVRATVAAWKAGATPMPLARRLAAADRRAVLDLARPALVVDGPLPLPDVSDAEVPDRWAACWKAPTSSGSTGAPAVVRAAAPARVDPDRPVASFVPHRAVQLVAGPLLHAAPFTYAMRGLMTGHTLVLPERAGTAPADDERFDAREWLRLVGRHRVTWSVLAPSAMRAVRDHPDRAHADVSSLGSVLHVGARCPVPLKRDWIDWLGPERVVEVYAGTESQGVAVIGGRDWLEHPGSVGRGTGGTRFRVVRADGTPCAPGEVGEIRMRRDAPTYHYLGREADVRDGWHTLGDRGHLDAEGWLYVGDRLSDLIRTGGADVDPADVEAVLEEHPGVRSCLVVGRPDDRDDGGGDAVHAVVEPVAEPGVDLDELAAWARERLPLDHRPRTWERSGGPLRDGAGKARRADWRVPRGE